MTALGFTVIGAVRSDAQAASFEPTVRCLRLDLAQPEDVARAAAEVRSLGFPLRALVNNAGASCAGALEDLPLEVTREVLEVDLFGPLQLTLALLPELRATGGRVVNVGSGEAFLATPLNAPYCMAKHALEALSVSLRLELQASVIHVSVISPGQTETPVLARAREQFAELSSRTSPPKLTAAGFSGADRGGWCRQRAPATRYHDDYYAAFLLDPDGNRLEAVYVS